MSASAIPLPTEQNPAIRQLEAAALPDARLADAAVLVAALPPGPEREALLVVLHARPGVVRELRRREAEALVAQYMREGHCRQRARIRAAARVGVSEAALRAWGL